MAGLSTLCILTFSLRAGWRSLLISLWRAVVDNIRRRIVGVIFPPSIFEDRCVDFRRSVSTFEDRCFALRRSMSRCVDLRRSMCRLSKIDVSTFGDRCADFRRSMCRPSEMDVNVDLRRPMIDVSTFEDL